MSSPRLRLLAAPVSAALAVLAAWAVVTVVDPNRTVLLPCPLLSLTGIACPFCGGTRAAHALAHGDVGLAADHNVMLLLAVPVAVTLWVRWMVRRARGLPAPMVSPSPVMLRLVGLGLLAFAIVRNLPAGGWLAP